MSHRREVVRIFVAETQGKPSLVSGQYVAAGDDTSSCSVDMQCWITDGIESTNEYGRYLLSKPSAQRSGDVALGLSFAGHQSTSAKGKSDGLALAEGKRRRREGAEEDSKGPPRARDSVNVTPQTDVDSAGDAEDAPGPTR